MVLFCDTTLDSYIMNASGPRCTTFMELKDLEESDSCAIVSKSCTLLPRQGNPGKRYWDNEIMSINSTGLANNGFDYYNLFNFDKPYIISVAGLTLQDNITILSKTKDRIIELNLSCPNIQGKGQVGYDFDEMENYLHKIYEEIDIKRMGLKMTPYFDSSHFEKAADIISEYPIRFVTCINSIGNGYVVEGIEANEGYGGVGGPCILPFALSNVRKFRQLLPDRIDIVGCGGIKTGKDVYQHLISGAKVVQVGTQFQKEGTEVFTRLNRELLEYL